MRWPYAFLLVLCVYFLIMSKVCGLLKEWEQYCWNVECSRTDLCLFVMDYFAQVPYRVKRVDSLRINIGSCSTKFFSSHVSIHSDCSELLSAQPIQGPIGISFDSRVVSFLYR